MADKVLCRFRGGQVSSRAAKRSWELGEFVNREEQSSTHLGR
jgi:hypothetical protein